jgi:predicted nucleic-acid-binding protein
MIGIDTNILLRLLEQDNDPAQSAAARALVRREGTVFINPVVMVEFVWVLRSSFELDRASIHARLKRIVAAPEFSMPFPEATERAVTQYGAGPADFVDCLMGELNRAFGCDSTMTFDKNASETPAFTSLKF